MLIYGSAIVGKQNSIAHGYGDKRLGFFPLKALSCQAQLRQHLTREKRYSQNLIDQKGYDSRIQSCIAWELSQKTVLSIYIECDKKCKNRVRVFDFICI